MTDTDPTPTQRKRGANAMTPHRTTQQPDAQKRRSMTWKAFKDARASSDAPARLPCAAVAIVVSGRNPGFGKSWRVKL